MPSGSHNKPGKVIPGGEKTQFSSLRQPTTEQRKEGWRRKRRGAELARAVLDLYFRGKENSKLKKEAAEYFDVPIDDISVEAMMLFKQVQRAMERGDTAAFNAVMDRAFGKAKQPTEISVTKGFYDFLKETSATSPRKRI